MTDLFFASIEQIHAAYIKKQVTVREFIMSCLSRIAEIDKCEKGLNSVLEINPDALFIAEALDGRLKKDCELPPLFGIPVLLKDNINTADRLHTSAGSVALADNYAPYDAHIVRRLRNAGAVILGKANMTEFANYMSGGNNMPSGYSSRGGQVMNPYNRVKTPGGSSSGSAVAVAAGICTVSVGTETSGSIISPAGQNGIVGIKPTIGLVSRSGIIPISSTLDTAGPMARTVRDAAILLDVISGYDPEDAATHILISGRPADYAKRFKSIGLRGVRIGINRSRKLEDYILKGEASAAFETLLKALSDEGAELIDNVNIDPNFAVNEIMKYEFKAGLNFYLSTLRGSTKMKTLRDIIEYNQSNPEAALKYGQSALIEAENDTSGTMTEPEYIRALAEREKAAARLDELFDKNRIDVMLCETFTNIAPLTGFPSLTIPVGQRRDRLPLDSYWIARRYDEGRLLSAACAAEKALGLELRPEAY